MPGFGIKDSLSRTTEVTTLCSKSGDGRRKICSEPLGWRNSGTSRLSPCFLGCYRPCDRLVDRAEFLRSVRRLAGEAQNLIVERTQQIGQALAILKSPYEKGTSLNTIRQALARVSSNGGRLRDGLPIANMFRAGEEPIHTRGELRIEVV